MALSSVDETYFANKFTRVAYRRVIKLTEADGAVPTWTELLDDPGLNEEIRRKLRKSDIEKIKTTAILNRQIRSLNKYRQLRGLFQLSEDVVSNLNQKSVDPETLLTEIAESVVKLRQNRSVDHTVINFGVGNNSSELAKSLLEDSGASFIPTGFTTFDSKNGGFGWGNLVVLGGTTGGGKSTLAAQLGINWSDMGEDVTIVPLEMNEREMTARLMANASGLDVRKIMFNKLSDGEKEIYWKAFKRFVKSKKRSEGTLRLFKPTHDMTIEEILASVYPLGSRIIIIDYISLLKGVDGDDAWQKLGAVARYCKIWAEANNAIVILLCQISAEGVIRYARSIAEHANYCVAEGTLVETHNGLVTVEDLAPPEGRATTRKGSWVADNRVLSENKIRKSTAWHRNGVKEVFNVRLYGGLSVQVTADHKFLTLDQETLERKWVKLKDLNVKDYVAVNPVSESRGWPRKEEPIVRVSTTHHFNCKETKIPASINKEMGYLIGSLLADGHVSKSAFEHVTNLDEHDVSNELVSCIQSLFGRGHARQSVGVTKNGTGIVRIKFNSAKAMATIHHNLDGLTGGFAKKFIPSKILVSPKPVVAACLRGLFDGDGTVTNFVALDLQNTKMIQQVQLLLGRFGIQSSVNRSGTRVQIFKAESLRLFSKHIGFVGSKKQTKLDALIGKAVERHASADRSATVPYLRGILSRSRNYRYGKDPAQSLLRAYKAKWPTSEIQKHRIRLEDKSALESVQSGLWGRVKDALSFSWSQIDCIESVGPKKVYDISVPETENYVANGIVVHNCWTFIANQQTQEQEILNIEQLKARNGERFPFTLKATMSNMRVRDLEIEERDKLNVNATVERSGPGKKSKKLDKTNSGTDVKVKPPGEYLKDLSDDEED